MTHEAYLARDYFARQPDKAQLQRAYELRSAFQSAVVTNAFDGRLIGRDIVPSKAGERLLDELADIADAEVLRFALFMNFFDEECLFDTQRTDLAVVTGHIGEAIRQRQLLLPSRWGRRLYDRFNDLAAEGRLPYTQDLTCEQAELLMHGEAQGIYQLGSLLIGPNGLRRSASTRWLSPTTVLQLWHCSDLACPTLHSVKLHDDQKNPSLLAYQAMAKRLRPIAKDYPWQSGIFFSFFEDSDGSKQRDRHIDLGILLIECLTLADLRYMAAEALRTGLLSKEGVRGPLDKHVEKLSREDVLTDLLTLDTSALVTALDTAIHDKRIRIEPGEIRTPYHPDGAYGGSRDTRSEISSLGVREKHSSPLAAFVAHVLGAYGEIGTTKDLEWKLRQYKSEHLADSLVRAIANQGIESVARGIVLDARPIAESFATRLGVPVSRLDDAEVFLWKSGFDVQRPEIDACSRVSERIGHFEETVRGHRGLTQADRDAIRSSGVNLFVDLEAALDEVACFLVWLLASDHLTRTHFLYRHSEARRQVAETLGAERSTGSSTVRWDILGQNTLGVLLSYLQAADSWATELLDRDPMSEVRTVMPDGAKEPLFHFPFRHSALWADMPRQSLKRLTSAVSQAVACLNRSNCALVRNGLDHTRPPHEFPTVDELLRCSSELRQALSFLYEAGVVPVRYKYDRVESHRIGISKITLRSGRGELHCMSSEYMSGLPSYGDLATFVVSPSDVFGFQSLPLVFEYIFESEYASYRANFPRRPKQRVHAPNGESVAQTQQGDGDHDDIGGEPAGSLEN